MERINSDLKPPVKTSANSSLSAGFLQDLRSSLSERIDVGTLAYRGESGQAALALLVKDISHPSETESSGIDGPTISIYTSMTLNEIREEFRERGIPYSRVANGGYAGERGLAALRRYAQENFVGSSFSSLEADPEANFAANSSSGCDAPVLQGEEKKRALYARLGLMCPACGYVAPNKRALERHGRKEGHNLPQPSASDTSEERLVEDDSETPVLCGMCGVQFKSVVELNRHIDRDHQARRQETARGLFDEASLQ
jgi:uncharacterized C2H2 Zn-finger protein